MTKKKKQLIESGKDKQIKWVCANYFSLLLFLSATLIKLYTIVLTLYNFLLRLLFIIAQSEYFFNFRNDIFVFTVEILRFIRQLLGINLCQLQFSVLVNTTYGLDFGTFILQKTFLVIFLRNVTLILTKKKYVIYTFIFVL